MKSARNALFIIALSLFLLPTIGSTKTIDFSKTMFGVELSALGMKSAKTSFLPDAGSFESSYVYEYHIGLFFDLGSVILLRPGFSILSLSDGTATGTDASDGRAFTQTLESSGTMFSGKISLVPFVSDDNNRRIYFGGEVGIASISLKRQRAYASGAAETNSQEASGSGIYLGAHLGFEMFLVQNYSLGIEVGYRKLELSSFEHESGTSMRGASVDEGTELLDEAGRNEAFNLNGATVSASFNLHF